MRGNDLEVFCGTPSGYVAHRKSGEDACDECKRAAARYKRELRRAQTPPQSRAA